MKRAFAFSLILALLSSVLAGTLSCRLGLFDFVVYGETAVYGTDDNVAITIVSPEDKVKNNVTVVFELQAPEGYALSPQATTLFDKYLRCGCVLDYDRARVVDTLWVNWNNSGNKTHLEEYNSLSPQNYEGFFAQSNVSYVGEVVLPVLSEGIYNFTVWVRAEQNYLSFGKRLWAAFSETYVFTVDDTVPRVLVLSPAPLNYNSSAVMLNFSVDEAASEIAYSLDEGLNVTVSGNTTLTGLSDGTHSMILYAWDEAGSVGASTPVTFTVTAFPATLVIAAVVVAVVVVCAGLLLYFLRRKR
jgi:hypothetical protein